MGQAAIHPCVHLGAVLLRATVRTSGGIHAKTGDRRRYLCFGFWGALWIAKI